MWNPRRGIAARLAATLTLAAAALALAPQPANAAIAVVGQSSAQTGGASSLTINQPSGTAADEVEIATVSVNSNATITTPSGWTVIVNNLVGSSLRQESWWHITASGSDASPSFNFSASGGAAGGIIAYSGVDTTTMIDEFSNASASSGTTATAPSVTTTYAGDQVIGIASFDNAQPIGTQTGFQSRYSQHAGASANAPTILAEDANQASAGASTAQAMTDTTSSPWIAQTITLMPAGPAITEVGQNQAQGTAASLTVNQPGGVQAGYVEIAAVAVNSNATITAPAGWTVIDNTLVGTSLRQESWWHVALASETNPTFSFSASVGAAGGLIVYSGVDTSSPIDQFAASSAASGTTATAPSVTTTFPREQVLGFASFSSNQPVGTQAGFTSRFAQHAGSGPSIAGEDASQASAGATTAQAMTNSISSPWIGQTVTLKPASGPGVLSLSTSASPAFSDNLNAGDQTQTYTIPATVVASVNPSAGWNATLTSTTFTSGTHTLSTGASTIASAPAISCDTAYANCGSTTNSTSFPVGVPAAATPPAAVKFLSFATGSAGGRFTVTPTVSVSIPQNSFAGTYTSTVTLAIVSGP